MLLNNFKFIFKNLALHYFTSPYTPQQNEVGKRKHRHIIKSIRTLIWRQTPIPILVHAPFTIVSLIKRLSLSTTHQKIAISITQKPPIYHHLRVFSCLWYPWIPPTQHHKLQPKATSCIFLGYTTQNTTTFTQEALLSLSHVTFHENVPIWNYLFKSSVFPILSIHHSSS